MTNKIINIVLAFSLAAAVSACSMGPYYEAPDEPEYNGILTERSVTDLVTIKRSPEGTVFLQYGRFKLLPEELAFERQRRVMAQMTVFPQMEGEYYKCKVDWIEQLEEGRFLYAQAGAKAPAGDGLDIILGSEYTRVDDGYLSVHYLTWGGGQTVHHDFDLIAGLYPDDPYALVLVQDSNSDAKESKSEGMVCFDINDLPPTGGETRTITLYWTELDGTTGKLNFGFKTR